MLVLLLGWMVFVRDRTGGLWVCAVAAEAETLSPEARRAALKAEGHPVATASAVARGWGRMVGSGCRRAEAGPTSERTSSQ